MNKFAGVAAFFAGAAVGAAASWYFTKNKYEQIAQEEINSVKEAFLGAPCEEEEQEEGSPSEDEEDSSDEVHTPVVAEKPSIEEYVAMVEDRGYTKYSDAEKKEVKPMEVNKKPYVIPPEEFGEIDDYGTCSLTYYADKVLADELDEMVENIEDAIGFESLTHFGEYEDDSVFVRNERLKCDYEILLDVRKYTDVLKKKPYKENFYDGWPTE